MRTVKDPSTNQTVKRFDKRNVVIYAPLLSNRGVIQVVTALQLNAYSGYMLTPKKRAPRSTTPRVYPNRIRELNKLDSAALDAGQTLIAPLG